MKKQILGVLFMIFINQIVAQPSISIESFASGFDKPVSIKHAGDTRLFVIEQEGFIRILNADGTINSQPFLDIENQVGGSGTIGDERGLLGLAFHPNYATNGFFYVNYINSSGNTIVSRFSVSGSNANLADATSELLILPISQPASNHNGGDMAFGADGFLYISSGDGGGSGDQSDNAQNLNSLLGKILRIDVNSVGNGNNYAIPADNPFISNTAARDEIWAYGVRNVWKFSFDRDNGDLWLADVGQGSFEEINKASASESGLNYGWRCYEGAELFNGTGCPNMSTLTFPVATYPHSNSSSICSVTGGYRYRGSLYPSLSGLYFFADYCSNEIGVLEENGTLWDMTFTAPFNGNNWAAFGEDVNGELYVAGISSGTIYKIIDGTLSVNTPSVTNFKMYPNPAKEELNFEFRKTTSAPKKISVYDIQGRLVKTIENFSSHVITISTQNFNKGLYFIEILGINGEKAAKKLVLH